MDPLPVWYGSHAPLFLHEPPGMGRTVSDHHTIAASNASLLADIGTFISLAWSARVMEDHQNSFPILERYGSDCELAVPFVSGI